MENISLTFEDFKLTKMCIDIIFSFSIVFTLNLSCIQLHLKNPQTQFTIVYIFVMLLNSLKSSWSVKKSLLYKLCPPDGTQKFPLLSSHFLQVMYSLAQQKYIARIKPDWTMSGFGLFSQCLGYGKQQQQQPLSYQATR